MAPAFLFDRVAGRIYAVVAQSRRDHEGTREKLFNEHSDLKMFIVSANETNTGLTVKWLAASYPQTASRSSSATRALIERGYFGSAFGPLRLASAFASEFCRDSCACSACIGWFWVVLAFWAGVERGPPTVRIMGCV